MQVFYATFWVSRLYNQFASHIDLAHTPWKQNVTSKKCIDSQSGKCAVGFMVLRLAIVLLGSWFLGWRVPKRGPSPSVREGFQKVLPSFPVRRNDSRVGVAADPPGVDPQHWVSRFTNEIWEERRFDNRKRGRGLAYL